jgi:hypothetical protein
MFTINDIKQNLAGAWALLKGDAQGADLFDTSFRGFWLSFAAIALLIPVYGIYLLGEQRVMEAMGHTLEASAGNYVAVRGFTFVMDWIAFPVLMIVLVRLLDRQSRYVPFVVAYNWGGVLLGVFVALPTILFAAGMMPLALFSIFTLVAVGVALRYRYITARVMLFADPMTAVGLVAADFALSLLLAEMFSRVFGF